MNRRIERINELIKEQLSLLVQRDFSEKLGIIIINSVETAKDLKLANVYISSIDGNEEDIVNTLQKKSFNFHRELAKVLTMRNIPKVQFIYDKCQNKIDKVEELLKKINSEM